MTLTWRGLVSFPGSLLASSPQTLRYLCSSAQRAECHRSGGTPLPPVCDVRSFLRSSSHDQPLKKPRLRCEGFPLMYDLKAKALDLCHHYCFLAGHHSTQTIYEISGGNCPAVNWEITYRHTGYVCQERKTSASWASPWFCPGFQFSPQSNSAELRVSACH